MCLRERVSLPEQFGQQANLGIVIHARGTNLTEFVVVEIMRAISHSTTDEERVRSSRMTLLALMSTELLCENI